MRNNKNKDYFLFSRLLLSFCVGMYELKFGFELSKRRESRD